MKLVDIMTPNPKCIVSSDTLADAARQMRDYDVGCLPVCDDNRLVGVITDRDITVRAIAEGKDPNAAVRDVMTSAIVYGFADEDIEDAAFYIASLQVGARPQIPRPATPEPYAAKPQSPDSHCKIQRNNTWKTRRIGDTVALLSNS